MRGGGGDTTSDSVRALREALFHVRRASNEETPHVRGVFKGKTFTEDHIKGQTVSTEDQSQNDVEIIQMDMRSQ